LNKTQAIKPLTFSLFKYKLSLTVLSLLLFSVIHLKGQSTKIVQLKDQLREALKSDTSKINILNKLSWEYHRIDVQTSFDYAQEALDLSKKIEYKKGWSRALNLQGIAYAFKGEFGQSFEVNQKALSLAKEINDSFLLSACYNDLGILYDSNKKDREKALESYHEALRYSTSKTSLKFFTLMNLSILYNDQGNEKQSDHYLMEAIKEGKTKRDTQAILSTNSYLGYFYENKEQLDSALNYYNIALNLAESSGDLYSVAALNSDIGYIYGEKKLFELAKNHLDISLELYEEMGNQLQMHYTLLTLSENYNKAENYAQAIEYGEKGFQLCMDVGDSSSLVHYHEILAEAYAGAGDFEKAYQLQKKVADERDTIHKEEQERVIAEIETSFKVEQQEKENEILKAKKDENEARLRFQSLWLWGSWVVAILAIALLIVLYNLFRARRRYSMELQAQVEEKTASLSTAVEELKATNEELERFTFIASHDLKEPIRNIVSFSNLLKNEVGEDNQNSQEYIDFITKSARHLYALISDVLEFSRINKEEIPTELVDVNQIIKNIEEEILISREQEKEIQIHYESMPSIQTSGSHFYLIMKNLIENGVKYNQNSPATIHICYKEENGYHYFSVKDNGIGIPEQFHEKIFGMFKRLHTKQEFKGTGMGLAICRKILMRLKGDISLESHANEGSTFTFHIPKHQ
jgi:signal transduction histidine kinase